MKRNHRLDLISEAKGELIVGFAFGLLLIILMLIGFVCWVWNTAIAQQQGLATVYGPGDSGGTITATGERVDPTKLTAAHATLPFGALALVKNRRNGRHVVVRINDRGPFKGKRIIDVTQAGATKLGMTGLDPVTVVLAPCIFSERFNAALWAHKPSDRAGCTEDTP